MAGRSGLGRLALACVMSLSPLLVEARIPRDRAEVRAFRAENPCPSTGLTRGRCDGWEVDHIIPLCAAGADKRENFQWISKEDHRFKTYVDVRECRKLKRKD